MTNTHASTATHTFTHESLNARVDLVFERMIESDLLDLDNMTSDDITLFCAGLAAKFASYAMDAIDF